MLGRGSARVAEGAAADLVVWETERAEDVIAALAPPLLAIKRGRITVEHRHSIAEPWRTW
jgi:imidazolonepropionase-like amidohydrolase